MNNKNTSVTPPKGWRQLPLDSLALKGARLYDPAMSLDNTQDLVIKRGNIHQIGTIPADFSGETIDASGWTVVPGLFDMHVHLREPGFEYKETVRSGGMAAAIGGFTGVACMPNTNPAIDNNNIVDYIRERAAGLPVDVHPIGATTVGRQGKELTEIGDLYRNGVTAFSDDGSPVVNAGLMRRALEYTRMFDCVIIEHCEEPTLSGKGVMDEGAVSTRLGLPGWPAIAEEIAIERNIRLAEYTGGRLHIAHISTAIGVNLVRQAKARGVKVTAEACVHHLTMTSELLNTYNSDFKVNPPLRTQQDVDALITGIADGTIDAIATDHAPHARHEKEVEFIHAPFGMTGLETSLGVILTKLVKQEKISLARVIDAMSHAPRNILHLTPAVIKEGTAVNLTLIDPTEQWEVDRKLMVSLSDNTPYHGWNLTGRARGVMNRGIAWIRQES